MNYTMKLSKEAIAGEEMANSVTHAVGALLMLMLPISAVYNWATRSAQCFWDFYLCDRSLLFCLR